MSEASKHRLLLVLRITASIVILAVVLTRVPSERLSGLMPEWTTATAVWLLGAALLTLVGVVLSAVRWQQVLRALDLDAGMRDLLPMYFAGQFVSNVLPTTIGGDLVRISRLSRKNGETPGTFASVVLERLSGWLVLPLITFVGFIVNPGLRELGLATQVAIALAVATLVGLGLLLLVAASRRIGGRISHSEGWRRFVGAIHYGLEQMRQRPSSAVGVLAAGFAYQLVLVIAAVMAAQALGLNEAGFTALLAFLPAVLIAQVLPIGISGLGIREGAFVLFLTPLGVPAEQAIALGLLLYALNLLVGLLGAPSFAFGPREERALA